MLYGHAIVVKTDHKNLTHHVSTHASDRVLRQRLLLEEYGVELQYIEGEKNIVADALSRLPTEEFFRFDEDNDFPLQLAILAREQLTDDHLQAALQQQPSSYFESVRDDQTIYVHKQTNSIYVPVSLRGALTQWYHTSLQHPGIKRMQATIKEHFYWPGMDAAIDAVVRVCPVCQKCKITAVKKYGKIPLPTHRNYKPWEEVHVDLIGPWDVRYNSTSVPGNRPARVVYDNGAEFTGQEFQELLDSYGIKAVSTTVRNPKSNGVIERVHLTMGDMLRTMTFSGTDWFADMQRALDAVAWAIRTTINPMIKHSPCHLAFNQDMIFRRAVQVDWDNIHQERHKSATASTEKENKSRINKQYVPGDKVLIVLDTDERRGQPKLSQPTKGPFTITTVHNNGTVSINRGRFIETINIRRLKPFHS